MHKLLAILTIALISTQLTAQTNYSPEVLQKIKEIENNIVGEVIVNDAPPGTITERMAKYHVKGMSIAVIHDYKIEWAKGYGWADEAEKRPVTTETLFQPGSISKALQAVGILKLAQEKKVDLNTDINTYLKSWKFPYDTVSHGKKITLAHLMSHTAGLSTHGFPGYNIKGDIPDVFQILDAKPPAITSTRLKDVGLVYMQAVRSMFEPGLGYQYSGGGATITQLLLSDVTGQSYEKWMDKNVLKPIGMTHSTYMQPPSRAKQDMCASGYYRDGSPVTNKFQYVPAGAGGLWMTPSDLCQYILDMQLAYQGKKPSAILNPEMVQLHLTAFNNGPTSMGSFIDDHDGVKYFQHAAGGGGSCGQFFASLEDGNGVVVFLNSEDGQLLYEVINSVAKTYNWKNFYNEPRRKTIEKSIPMDDNLLKKYEGIYVFENTWAAIGKRDNQYHFFAQQWQGRICAKMYFDTPIRFYNEEFTATKEFIKDENGNIVGYTRTADGKRYPDAIKVLNPDTLTMDSTSFEDMGWYLFENKNYAASLAFLRRGAELYPHDLNMLISMAHVYVFNNEVEKAIPIYKAHLKDSFIPECSWVDMMKNDLIYFTDHHYDVKQFDEVFAVLKIRKPKGY